MKKEEERNIYAVFDDKTIRVYQAYNNEIADEALKLGKFEFIMCVKIFV